MAAGLPRAIEKLMHELTRLPGMGRRGAERVILHLLARPKEQAESLALALTELHLNVHPCPVCGHWSEGETCAICADQHRSSERLCVVEKPSDVWAFEQADAFEGRYHVLGGVLSPMAGITAEDLNIDTLERRIADEGVREVILATNPSVDGDATAHYLAGRLRGLGVAVTRIATGVPLGGHLDYADAGTLRLALNERRHYED